MIVEIDDKSGFCYGVKKTISLAEEALTKGTPLYSLGEIVHNEEEVKRLSSKGLGMINHTEMASMQDTAILIRAHGEPPSTYEQLKKNGIHLTDGTCPIVLKLQQKVKDQWLRMKEVDGQVVIYGKRNHAEVIGLAGQTSGEALVIEDLSETDRIDFTKPVALFSQTTQTPAVYAALGDLIRRKMVETFQNDDIPLYITNSICGHVSKRGEHLAEFSKRFEVIVFVSGAKSSNGKVLLDVCKKSNPNTYWVSGPGELHSEWFRGVKTVGICGATSTPQWLMESVSQTIQGFEG